MSKARTFIPKLCVLAFGLGIYAANLGATNIVLDPGFESGTFSNWQDPNDDWGIGSTGDNRVHSGSLSVETGCVGAACLNTTTGAVLYQDLPTVISASYTLSFWYSPDNGTPNELDVYWGGTLVDAIVNDLTGTGYHQITVTSLLASAGTTRLQFNGRQDPAWLNIDDVCVSTVPGDCAAASGVPEPGTSMLFGSGLLAFGFLARRLRKS